MSNDEKVPMDGGTTELMKWMGMDGERWTQAFLQVTDLANAGPDFRSTVHAWLANALETGRSSEYGTSLNHLQFLANSNAHAKGWWDDDRTFGDVCTLIHSEVSEAYEEFRNGRDLDERYYSLADFDMTSVPEKLRDLAAHAISDGWQDLNEESQEALVRAGVLKPEGIPSELADVVIRIMDTASEYRIDLLEAILLKMAFNATRKHRHGGKRT